MGSQNTESKTFYIMKTRLISRAEVLGEKSRGQVKVSFAKASLPTDFWKGERWNILELDFKSFIFEGEQAVRAERAFGLMDRL